MTNEPSSETPTPADFASADSAAIAEADRRGSGRRVLTGFVIGCAISLAMIVPAEIDRWN